MNLKKANKSPYAYITYIWKKTIHESCEELDWNRKSFAKFTRILFEGPHID